MAITFEYCVKHLTWLIRNYQKPFGKHVLKLY